jgi:hypothetical protein
LADSVIRQVALDFVLVRRLGGAGNNQSDERDDQEKPIHITVGDAAFHPVRLWANDLVPNQGSLEGIFMQANTNIKKTNTTNLPFGTFGFQQILCYHGHTRFHARSGIHVVARSCRKQFLHFFAWQRPRPAG